MASQLSGLSSHVIRIWERRYGALSPSRTETNRRLFDEEAIERLQLLRELTENGLRIGSVAKLPTEELKARVSKLTTRNITGPKHSLFNADSAPLVTPQEFIAHCLEASRAYDSERLRRLLLRSRQQFGQRGMLHHVICPLVIEIGDSWQAGNLRPSHEHIATAVIREILMTPVSGCQTSPTAPEIIITTLSGETHEMGALMVAATARDLGWNVTYLGSSLPVEEIAACASARKASAVAISVVYPKKCPLIETKLRSLRELLPDTMTMIVGGRAAKGYQDNLSDLKIHWASCLNTLDEILVQTGTAS